ncbi:MAG: DNA topoisomerase VI subunit B [Candidatus Odinarchaeia archaeon]
MSGTAKDNVNYSAISPADFFYRNRDIAGFDNPTRAIYTAIRELIENSLDACEERRILPDIVVVVQREEGDVYRIRVEDNGGGVPREHITQCFGQILYGSKYKHKQTRGRFGLGGKMAYLYAQITTNKPLHVITAPIGDDKIYDVYLRMNIRKNIPERIKWEERENKTKWHGTIVEFSLEGDWERAKRTVIEYIRQTALITPYANIVFIDPNGLIYTFYRTVNELPPSTKEVKPHPRGVDIEQVRRLIEGTKYKDMISFLSKNFHRVGPTIAKKFLKKIRIDPKTDPKSLSLKDIVKLVQGMKKYDKFLPPSSDCLSPLGEKLLEAGIKKELKPEFIAVTQRPPSSYGGHPFIVEVGLAFGGEIPPKSEIILYRFANRIPLIYDEYKDVSAKVIKNIQWNRYKIKPGMPIAAFVHLVSTKIPFKTAGKEFIADRVEIEREIKLGLQECARKIMMKITKKEKLKKEKQRVSIYEKFLKIIAENIAALADMKQLPPYEKLISQRVVEIQSLESSSQEDKISSGEKIQQ